MSKHPSANRLLALGLLTAGPVLLSACVVDAPARPGVDYGYVGGAYSSRPYYDDGPYYYGDAYYGNAYYGPTYYPGYYYAPGYGTSTTYVYTRDHYYPAYRHPHDRDDHDHDDHGHHDHDGDHGGHGDRGGRGDHDGGSNIVGYKPRPAPGGWNHDRPNRPDIEVRNPEQSGRGGRRPDQRPVANTPPIINPPPSSPSRGRVQLPARERQQQADYRAPERRDRLLRAN